MDIATTEKQVATPSSSSTSVASVIERKTGSATSPRIEAGANVVCPQPSVETVTDHFEDVPKTIPPPKLDEVDKDSDSTITTAASQISLNHYERLIEELKCPGCARPMKAPVYLCKSGHSICHHCTRVLMLCPLCKEPFSNLRSLTVEALCGKALFRCRYASSGCTLRLQLELLSWHELQCTYKPVGCFMGRVWGNCNWTGLDSEWWPHVETEHKEKVFRVPSVNLIWNLNVKQKPLMGYYIFKVFAEMFFFYAIRERGKILFTMTCASLIPDRKNYFAFEVTMIHKYNEALAITQKYPVHSEYDSDILSNGTCVSITLTDLAKFVDNENLLHYNVRVLQVKCPYNASVLYNANVIDMPNQVVPNFQETRIAGVNLKGVPAEVIYTRQPKNHMALHSRECRSSSTSALLHGQCSESSSEYGVTTCTNHNQWGTPQMHFDVKFLNSNVINQSTLSTASCPVRAEHRLDESPDDVDDDPNIHRFTKNRVTSSLKKSFRTLKTDIADMKNYGRKQTNKKQLDHN